MCIKIKAFTINININQFQNKKQKKMGDKFFLYITDHNNCQDFVLDNWEC